MAKVDAGYWMTIGFWILDTGQLTACIQHRVSSILGHTTDASFLSKTLQQSSIQHRVRFL